jgi:hypothetical protein
MEGQPVAAAAAAASTQGGSAAAIEPTLDRAGLAAEIKTRLAKMTLSSTHRPPAPSLSAAGVEGNSSAHWVTWHEEGEPGQFHPDFADTASKMNPLLRRVLVGDELADDGAAAAGLLGLLDCDKLNSTRAVLQREGVVRRSGCAALRAVVDAERDTSDDSVDWKAQHQLNIKVDRLTELIGREDVLRLWRLADELLQTQQQEAEAEAEATGTEVPVATAQAVEASNGGYLVDMFVRRYTRETRPWIPFHYDMSNITINVALSADDDVEGGRLHAIMGSPPRHCVLSRTEGEATAHGDDVKHAVSAMRSGTRYSLIMFFFALLDTPEFKHIQTVPKEEVDASLFDLLD